MNAKARAVTLFVLAGLAGCSPNEAGAPDQVPTVAPSVPSAVTDPAVSTALRSFEGRDGNHDGVLTSAENAAAADRLFDAIDKDGDGELTAAEIDVARDALGLAKTPSTQALIARADQDGDGELTLGEWIARQNRDFADSDTNGDGVLTKQEFVAGQVLRQAAPQPAPQMSQPPSGTAQLSAGAKAGH